MSAKKIARNGILIAVALSIFVLEAQFPPLTPLPGIKPGFANLVTLFALLFLGGRDAFWILLARILLGTLLVGNPTVLLYSLSGGLACLALEWFLLRITQKNFLWAVSALGALLHNTVQLLVAVIMTQTPTVFYYLPVLWISGLLTGLFNGLCIHFLSLHFGNRLRKLLS